MSGSGNEEEVAASLTRIGKLDRDVEEVTDACEEVMLLWGLRDPMSVRQGAFVAQGAQELRLEACGQNIHVIQAPTSLMKPGVTGAVMWDSGVVLAKFLEHAVHDRAWLHLRGCKCVELGAGCGLVGLKLLQQNVDENSLPPGASSKQGALSVQELTWGEDLEPSLLTPPVDFVLASDVVYSEQAVGPLVATLLALCTPGATTVLLAAELRNDAVLEAFLEAALASFAVGQVALEDLHPDFRSRRVVIYALSLRARSSEGQGPD
eukprot:jgi/Mesen1/9077/ME000578S08310